MINTRCTGSSTKEQVAIQGAVIDVHFSMQENRELWTNKRLHRFNTAQNRKLRLSDGCASLAETQNRKLWTSSNGCTDLA